MQNAQGLFDVVAPELGGIPSQAVANFILRLERQGQVMHSCLILRGGKLLTEAYWNPFDEESTHRIYSASKSFVSVAIGFLIDEGLLRLDTLVAPLFPEKIRDGGPHPYIAAMTVEHLLTMSSPHATSTYKQVADTDWVRTFLNFQPTRMPGMVFAYDTSATVTLTAIVELLSGQSLMAYLNKKLFAHIGFSESAFVLKTPLGMAPEELGGHPTWREVRENPAGLSHGGSAVICTPRDFARFALFCLNMGQHAGKQLVSRAYMEAATSIQLPTHVGLGLNVESRQGYGYQFWRTRNNGFCLWGMGGQFALCLPDHDLVIVATGDNQPSASAYQDFFDAVWEELLPQVSVGSLPDNPAGHAKLLRMIDGLELPLPEGVTESPTADGQTYQFDANEIGLVETTLSMADDRGKFSFKNTRGNFEIVFGIGKRIEHGFPEYGYRCSSAGAWLDARTFRIECMIIDDYLAQCSIVLAFSDDRITVVMDKEAEFFLDEYVGSASGRKKY